MNTQPLLVTPSLSVQVGAHSVACRIVCKQAAGRVSVELQGVDGRALPTSTPTTLITLAAFSRAMSRQAMGRAFMLLDCLGVKTAALSPAY